MLLKGNTIIRRQIKKYSMFSKEQNMSSKLLEVTRGTLSENIHRGDIAVVGSNGELLYYKGNPYKVTYLRSALKPILALNIFISGANQKYNFNEEEIALMCSSHYGQDMHVKVLNRILSKIGLKIDSLICGPSYSLNPQIKIEQITNHVKITAANSDCSGKHAGMLASCLSKGYSIDRYNSPDHPVQKDIKKIVSDICEIDEEKIIIGTDGCGVPVHGIPLYNAALGFAKFTCPENLKPQLANACNTIFNSINNSPDMITGTNDFYSEVIRKTNKKLIGKLGCTGTFCLAIKGLNAGIAIKIEDGNYVEAIPPVVMRCLEDLNVLTTDEISSLKSYINENITNDLNEVVGKVNAVFHLDKSN